MPVAYSQARSAENEFIIWLNLRTFGQAEMRRILDDDRPRAGDSPVHFLQWPPGAVTIADRQAGPRAGRCKRWSADG
jgi:hypothetical protein